MHQLTEQFREHHRHFFKQFGATSAGVQWGDEAELRFRYGKIAELLSRDFDPPTTRPTLLDVGCGWGGLLEYLESAHIDVHYTGIDLVPEMVAYGQERFKKARFIEGNVLEHNERYDYVVANGLLTQKLSFTIPEMESFTNDVIVKMYSLCRYGIAVNLMSTKVNYFASNLYYRNPIEMVAFCFSRLSSRVILDHSYSSLETDSGKLYDYMLFVYKPVHD